MLITISSNPLGQLLCISCVIFY